VVKSCPRAESNSIISTYDRASHKVRDFPIVRLNDREIDVLAESFANKIDNSHVCMSCMQEVRWYSERKAREMCKISEGLDYSKPIIIDTTDGRTYQTEKPITLAAAKAQAREWAVADGGNYVVLKPCSTFGPAKPKIIETKHAFR
jgi:hypothetical protein